MNQLVLLGPQLAQRAMSYSIFRWQSNYTRVIPSLLELDTTMINVVIILCSWTPFVLDDGVNSRFTALRQQRV